MNRVPHDQDEWRRLAAEFEDIRFEFSRQDILSKEDFERYRLHILTYGLISSNWRSRVANGAYYLGDPKEGTLEELASATQNMLADRVDEDVPDYLKVLTPSIDDLVDRVSRGLKERELCVSFIRDWGRLTALCAQIPFASQIADQHSRAIENAIAGAKHSVEIQKYWYAHWIKQNASSLNRRDRDYATNRLTTLCSSISRGRVQPWGPYPREWYRAILAKNPGDGLSEGINKLPATSLAKMLEHDLITPSILPPLSADQFSTTT